MPETIFGASLVEVTLLIVGIIVIYRIVKKTTGQVTDTVMETVMGPIAILIIVATILFAGLWLYRQGQWSITR